MKTTKIGKCPFCKSESPEVQYTLFYTYVKCINVECLASGPRGKTGQDAVDGWNKVAAVGGGKSNGK